MLYLQPLTGPGRRGHCTGLVYCTGLYWFWSLYCTGPVPVPYLRTGTVPYLTY